MLKKIIGPFHFTVCIAGVEVFSVSLFTDEDQALGYWGEGEEDDEDDDGEDDEDGDDDPDPTDAMLDTLNEIVRWEDRG